jgi:hypothetical protein
MIKFHLIVATVSIFPTRTQAMSRRMMVVVMVIMIIVVVMIVRVVVVVRRAIRQSRLLFWCSHLLCAKAESRRDCWWIGREYKTRNLLGR